jgi:hypothetical protein
MVMYGTPKLLCFAYSDLPERNRSVHLLQNYTHLLVRYASIEQRCSLMRFPAMVS